MNAHAASARRQLRQFLIHSIFVLVKAYSETVSGSSIE